MGCCFDKQFSFCDIYPSDEVDEIILLYTDSCHVESILVELHLPESIPFDPVVVRVAWICVGVRLRAVSGGYRRNQYKHTSVKPYIFVIKKL